MDSEQRDLLLSMSFLYLACGCERRALPLLLLVVADDPQDREALRALAHGYTATGRGELALAVLDRLLELGEDARAGGLLLLRSRALHEAGRIDEARHCFAAYAAANPRRQSGQAA